MREEIFTKFYKGDYADVRFSDLPKDIQPNDIIHIQRDEGYYSENNSYDSFTQLVVIREREETDDEFSKRMEKTKKDNEFFKQRRYETYLKLKEEFEINK